jgi:hypothetical protein
MSTRASTPATTLRGRWLVLARGAWVAVALFTVGVFVSGIPSEFARLRTPCSGTVGCVWAPRLTAENARELGELGLSVDLFAAYFVALEIAVPAAKIRSAPAAWAPSEIVESKSSVSPPEPPMPCTSPTP